MDVNEVIACFLAMAAWWVLFGYGNVNWNSMKTPAKWTLAAVLGLWTLLAAPLGFLLGNKTLEYAGMMTYAYIVLYCLLESDIK